ncbi:MAG: hypothetical protein LBE27_05820 [Deltaproteobacteria bacterium]|jgi:pyrrolysine biosynthesis protein PylD|nr:hypothetical protein [Deltaproteobacteria bacterium]
MTRLNENDLFDLSPRSFVTLVEHALGTDPLTLCQRAWDLEPKDTLKLSGKKLASVSVTTGEGPITGFAQSVARSASILGLVSKVMKNSDALGFREALEWGADIIISSDDDDFVAEELKSGFRVHNNPATARIFVAALEFLSGGSLRGKNVLVLGLGPVGLFATERLIELGARTYVFDTDILKLKSKCLTNAEIIWDLENFQELLMWERPLIFEAVPKEIIFSPSLKRKIFELSPKVSAPGVPLSWPTEWGAPRCSQYPPRLFHEALLAGTISMLAAFSGKWNADYGTAFPNTRMEAKRELA